MEKVISVLTLILDFHTASNSLSRLIARPHMLMPQHRSSSDPFLQPYGTIAIMFADLTPPGPPTSVCTSTPTSIIPKSQINSFSKLRAMQKLRAKKPPTWVTQDGDTVQPPLSVLRSIPQSALQMNADVPVESPTESPAKLTPRGTRFMDLPVEIHEGIIDHLYGILGSTSPAAAGSVHVLKNWSNAMRHPRRRQLSDLTLVSPTWRRIIQERLYRHSKSTCPAWWEWMN